MASPNYVPRLQSLGRGFLRIYQKAFPGLREEPFQSDAETWVADATVYDDSAEFIFTINQTPAHGIDPRGITSFDVVRYNSLHPYAGFDINFGTESNGTVDASCAAYHKPRGFSESRQAHLYAHDGSPLHGDPKVADAFLSDMLTEARQLVGGALQVEQGKPAHLEITGDPCGANFG